MVYRHDAQVPLGSNYEVDVAPEHGPYAYGQPTPRPTKGRSLLQRAFNAQLMPPRHSRARP